MRSRAFFLTGLVCLGLAGCTGTSNIDTALQISKPSMETTSSVVRPDVAVPVAEARAGIDNHVVEAGMTAIAEPDRLAAPAFEQVEVAMVTPPKPTLRPERTGRRGQVYRSRFSDAKPVSFGKITPKHHAVHGVDVSRWQGNINWPKLREHGANFAYIKATDGIDHIDPMFRQNWNAAHAAGIRRGAYHFFYWCRRAADQADWFIRNVPKVKGALPPVLDVEWNHQSSCKWRPSRAEILEKMQVFLDRLERHYGQRPIIYTAPDFYADNLKGAFPNHPFWLRSVAAHPSKVYPGRDWLFWQYSGSGLSGGVDGRIDLNVFNGDESGWWRWVDRTSG
ncbi:glycoside hydrolase family 25 protein [Nitratireductor sp. ZSWI3]|uniref:glycoside hydrolase family 25 protein n=1 Tax=Nitratireductor sp. ZSWI3 TaxID=2966359 RepID=UPI0021506654|nr:glycoside hydrolase family 25 protein [Nitratireductor sp. ZSWI3]MCR4267801.1 glycoside hydrolase family 25 protein [Nitratireductor sp. ZSWI3]